MAARSFRSLNALRSSTVSCGFPKVHWVDFCNPGFSAVTILMAHWKEVIDPRTCLEENQACSPRAGGVVGYDEGSSSTSIKYGPLIANASSNPSSSSLNEET